MKKRTRFIVLFLIVVGALLLVHFTRYANRQFAMMFAAKAIGLHYSRNQTLPADLLEIDGLANRAHLIYYAPVSTQDREGFIVAVQRQSEISGRRYIRLGDMGVHTCRRDEVESLLKADDERRRAVGEACLWQSVIPRP